MSFTETLRRIDDAGLDVYQYRMLMHFFRVGECWETVRTTAEKCNMSVGKASEVRAWLIAHKWLEWQETTTGRMVLCVCSPHEQLQQYCSPHEQIQQENGCVCSPDEQPCSPHEQECSPHERHLKNTSLRIPLEVEEDPRARDPVPTTTSTTSSSNGHKKAAEWQHVEGVEMWLPPGEISVRPAKEETMGQEALLVEWWLIEVGVPMPRDRDFARMKLIDPAKLLLARMNGDMKGAQDRLRAKRGLMLAEGKTPKWLEAIVPYVVADLDTPQKREWWHDAIPMDQEVP